MKNIEVHKYRLQILKGLKGFAALAFTTGLAYAGVLTFKRPVKKNTSKMLTQDGLLVEIDPRTVVVNKQKINPEEIHHWVKKKV